LVTDAAGRAGVFGGADLQPTKALIAMTNIATFAGEV
jgi:hypothetical protein